MSVHSVRRELFDELIMSGVGVGPRVGLGEMRFEEGCRSGGG